jgi:hypothetical protein
LAQDENLTSIAKKNSGREEEEEEERASQREPSHIVFYSSSPCGEHTDGKEQIETRRKLRPLSPNEGRRERNQDENFL